MQLIDNRQSARSYSSKDISEQTLSDLLWASFGINKKGTRTIPTAKNEQNLKVLWSIKTLSGHTMRRQIR